MPTELPRSYDPAYAEAEAAAVWKNESLFHADPSDPGEPYCIVIPPPNVTGALHLGHAINNTLQDILIRVHRMRGFNTLWIPGIDHAGIATQAVVEKQLREKEGKSRHDVGREGLVERIWAWKEQYGTRILEQLKRLGCSCDWDRTRFTLDDLCARAVRETFFKLFKDGLIYRGKRLVNWDTFLQTSISDDEIYHETVKTNLWHIRYPIDGSDKEMVVATTRPETMLGDTAVAVHSEDPRWNWAVGKFVKLPLTDRLIPIIADDILVDPKFGTGVVKVTPAHDPNDYAVWQRHQGKPDQIDLINILSPDGKLLDDDRWKKYSGLKRDQARAMVVDDLKSTGFLVKEEPYETQVGHSDRSKTAIEPYLSDQWFVKMAPLAEPALEVVREGLIKFYPSRFASTFLDWLGEKRDWPISRQLWWGHRIPVWTSIIADIAGGTSEDVDSAGKPSEALQQTIDLHKLYFAACGVMDDIAISPESNEVQSWLNICATSKDAEQAIGALTSVQPSQSGNSEYSEAAIALGNEISGIIEAPYKQDPDVLDTWFSSALWPHSTLGWPDETADLKKWYPTSTLVTSRDIITLWVARMVMTGIYNMGDGKFLAESPEQAKSEISNLKSEICAAIPFRDVHIHPTILDGKGERMSKSKGNGVDPIDIIDGYGADALRFVMTQMATETQDARLPVKKDSSGRNTSDKFDTGKFFCNKIWQVSLHFVMANLEKIAPEAPDESKWSLADRWIVSRFNGTVKAADEALAVYRFDQYAKACYDFFWGDFCDWYVEAIKPALRDEKRAGQTATVMAAVLDGALRLMHPMIPFVSEVLFWQLNHARPERRIPGQIELPASKRLIKAAWPKAGPTAPDVEAIFSRLREVIGTIRNVRNQYNISPKQSVTAIIEAPADFASAFAENREFVELLATCQIKTGAKPAATALHTTIAGCDVYVEDLADPEAEKKVSAKRCEDLKRQIAAMKGRLSNESYISKAPANLVQQTRDQLAEAESEAAKLGCG